ncbi:Crp/Fnr family transcriptional regulator [Epilithonimonas mollis]|uniref:cAMP-binding domain of CRP or a regulatory subunit of cAMP-dependent protein kinases n=1 Tax=Epilithonimonas mollis TaxID=216903 RepID=A0A1M6UM20_9FLAO|nr:Crp/Fnr family transcriptional regulator [Epilithonimonas mollis]SHK70252.1 cAMP-binding domain of CRP or a regulatory subunit of cAMP-dependent protein kinases [Epilithonimonas mollis]
MIEEDCLRLHGAVSRRFTAGTLLFSGFEEVGYYFQIVSGLITFTLTDAHRHNRICTISGRGEANYSILTDFPPLLDAIALTECSVLIMPKENFLFMVASEKGMMMHILKYLSEQLYNCMETNRIEFNKSPSDKIIELLHFLKFEETDQELFSLEIDLNLDQIAMMSGLNTEICIATIEKMEKDDSIKIRNGRIYF